MTPILKAALWMIGTITSFSVMAVAGREVAHALDTFEIMMYRSLVGVVIVCTLAAATGQFGQVRASASAPTLSATSHISRARTCGFTP